MAVDESNQAQADFWAAAGTMWTALRDRFDDQAGDHGAAAIEVLAPQAGERIIDIGCGAGSSTAQIARLVGDAGHVTGFDISATMIDGARTLAASEGLANVDLTVGDAMVEEFSGDFDALYSRFGVMFFSDATRGFANMRTAVRSGGRMAFVCWQSPVKNEWASVPLSVVGRFVDMPFGADPTAPGPFSLADPDRLGRVLGDAGWSDIEIEGRETPVRLGNDLDDAVDFVFGLMPPAGALRQNDPATADQVAAALHEAFGGWVDGDAVRAPSAVWIVTASSPG